MRTYMYSNLCVSEGFVVVAQGNGLMATVCQRGVAAIVTCVADGYQVSVWGGDDGRLCGRWVPVWGGGDSRLGGWWLSSVEWQR